MILETWDYITCTFLLAGTCSLGFYHMFTARKAKNAREFLYSSPDLGIVPIVLSSVATFVSGILMTGFPAETYTDGITYMGVALSLILTAPFITHLYLPIFFKLETRTVFEYLEYRFNKTVRLIASVLFTIQIILFTSVAIYAPSLALNQVTGLDFWGSVLAIGIICILYTSMGGIKAVVWADTAQVIIIMIVTIIIIIKGCIDLGGIGEVWQICTAGQRTTFFKMWDDGQSYYTFWTMAIGGTIHFLGFLGTNQMLMQRYLSNRTLTRARGCFIGSITTMAFVAAISAFCGLVMYAKYSSCDPLLEGRVTSRDQIMALFAVETLSFGKGLSGLFVAGLLCATLSTLSSCLNSVSAVIIEDYIRPFKPNLSEANIIRLSKVLGVACGLLCIGAVAVAQSVGGVMKAVFSMVGMVGGPILALFTIGMLVPWANAWGAIAGFGTAILLTGWAALGGMLTKPDIPTAPMTTAGCNVSATVLPLNDTLTSGALASDPFPLYTLSPLWYACWSCVIMMIIGPIVSLIFGSQKENVDPNLFHPMVIKLVHRLPVKYQQYLGMKPTPISSTTMDNGFADQKPKTVPMDTLGQYRACNSSELVDYNEIEELEPMTQTTK